MSTVADPVFRSIRDREFNIVSGNSESTKLPFARNWINGEWRTSVTQKESFDPATGKVLGRFADGGEAEARDAIAAARAAFENGDWRRDRHLRARVLHEIADLLEAHRDEVIDLLCKENGKIRPEANYEYDMCAPKLRYAAALALTEFDRAMEVQSGSYSMTLRQPVGVVGVITPWNSPVVLMIRSINDWAVVYDEFDEGGLKQSSAGRLNGPGSLKDFVETKHIFHRAGVVEPQ